MTDRDETHRAACCAVSLPHPGRTAVFSTAVGMWGGRCCRCGAVGRWVYHLSAAAAAASPPGGKQLGGAETERTSGLIERQCPGLVQRDTTAAERHNNTLGTPEETAAPAGPAYSAAGCVSGTTSDVMSVNATELTRDNSRVTVTAASAWTDRPLCPDLFVVPCPLFADRASHTADTEAEADGTTQFRSLPCPVLGTDPTPPLSCHLAEAGPAAVTARPEGPDRTIRGPCSGIHAVAADDVTVKFLHSN